MANVACLVGIIAGLLSWTSLAAAQIHTSTDPTALIEEVLASSGTKTQLARIPALVQAQVISRKAEMKPADYVGLSRVMAESYGTDALYGSVAETFKGRFDERRLVAILHTLHAPLFRKITHLEFQASRPAAAQRVEKFAAQLTHQSPSDSRLALIWRVDEAAGVSKLNLEIIEHTVRGIALAIDPALPPSKRLKMGQLDQVLSRLRERVRVPLKNQIAIQLLYTYQSLTDQELRHYLGFLESDHGRWFARVSREALVIALTGAAKRAGRQMREMRPAHRSSATGAPSSPTSDDQRKWALAASALVTERSGQRHDLLGGTERTEANIRRWKRIMRERWGIQDRVDLFATLKWLDEGGHRQDFAKIGAFADSLSQTQYRQVLARVRWNPVARHQHRMVKEYYRGLGTKSLLGWDYARYIVLCRWGYLVGYLTEEEAWERIMPAARTLQVAFDSWEDLAENYLIGREFWSLGDRRADGQRYRDAYDRLLNDPESPWMRYSWNMNLDAGLEPLRGSAILQTAPQKTD